MAAIISNRLRIGTEWRRRLCFLVLALTGSITCAFSQYVYVLDSNNGVSGYTVDVKTGMLTAAPGMPFAAGVNPSAIAVDSTSRFVYVANTGSNDVSGYTVDTKTGALTPVPGSPFAAGAAPSDIAIDPAGRWVYVANSASRDISAFTIDAASGALTPVPGSPFAVNLSASHLAVDSSGNSLILSHSTPGTASAYTIARNGALTPLSSFPAVENAESVVLDRTGRFGYATSARTPHSSALAFTSGKLIKIPGSTRTSESAPPAIAVHPTGKFVYVASGTSITAYAFNADSGTLTPMDAVEAARGLLWSGLDIDPDGKLVYQVGDLDNRMFAYRIDAGTGALTPVPGSPFKGPLRSHGVAVARVPDAFTLSTATALVTGFKPGPARNDLSSWIGMKFTVGSSPITVAALGRAFAPGNSAVHVTKLVRASDGMDVPGASVEISMASGTVGQFVYGQLPTPVTLDANTSYYLVSQETSGGDQWYDLGPVTATSAAKINNGVWYFGGYHTIGSLNSSYAVNLVYAIPPSVSITAPLPGATITGPNLPVSATATAAPGLSISSVQFQIDNVNQGAPVTASPYNTMLDVSQLTNGSHTLVAIATDIANNSTTSTPVNFTMSSFTTPTSVSIAAPVSGTQVSGNLFVSASVTPGTGLTIRSVQFKVDNANQGLPFPTAPYSILLDTTKLTDGPHTLTVSATDSASNTVTSPPVTINVSNVILTPTTVVITAPVAGATVSGNMTVSALAAPGTALTISSVQFKLDNTNLGGPLTASPYTTVVDTTKLTNGIHILSATATDSANNVTASQTIFFTVNNGGPRVPTAVPLLIGFTPGPARDDLTSWIGMKFTVGSLPLTVTALGRAYVAGNTDVHFTKLVRASDGVDVPGASVVISMTLGTVGQFVYGQLSTPVTLDANTSYYLVSQEISGGDQWYDLGPVTATKAATINGGVSSFAGFHLIGVPNSSYAVNLLYAIPPSVAITAPLPGATVLGASLPISATATAAPGLSITGVQFQLDNVNLGGPVTTSPYGIVVDATQLSNGSHTLIAIATDSANNSTTSAPVTFNLNNFTAPTTVSIAAPVSGTKVSGSLFVSASVTPGTGLTLSSVQFKLDNGNQGAPLTVGPYSIVIDTTKLSDGPHTLTVSATDSANNTVTSTPVTITVSNVVLTPTTIAITAPAAGATVSGNMTVAAAVTPGTGLTISSVQFKLDNTNQGAPLTAGPYTIVIDTTTLTNGVHILAAAATDSAHNVTASQTVFVTVNNAGVVPPPLPTALLIGFSPGQARSDLTSWIGMKFTVGSTPITVEALGRAYVPGNTDVHLTKLVRASDGTDVPGAFILISMASGTAGQFVYGQLPAPVTLDANTSYYLVSNETSGGDQWYDLGPVTATSAATINGGVANLFGFHSIGGPNSSYAVNLIYTIPPTVVINVPPTGTTVSGSSVQLSATATAAPGLSITSVQFQIDNVNQGPPVTGSPYSIVVDATKLANGPHTVIAIATDSANNSTTSASITITVNNFTASP